eukprot:COSAG01_NODE_1410_length_10411_cov_7.944337_3_plen_65_part_00
MLDGFSPPPRSGFVRYASGSIGAQFHSGFFLDLNVVNILNLVPGYIRDQAGNASGIDSLGPSTI